MSQNAEGPASSAEGQAGTTAAGTANQTATIGKAPEAGAGQAGAGDGTSTAAAPASEETFYDSNNVPPELMSHYKEMQRAFTKKSRDISANRQKIESYDAFMADPETGLRRTAAQYGYQVTPIGQQAATQQTNSQWEPQTWDEVVEKIGSQVLGKVKEHLAPVFSNVQQVTAQNIERQLDEIDPQWRIYEDDMKQSLKQHPTLVSDVAKLYRISVPESVMKNKAIQEALKKQEDKVQAAQVHGGKSGTRTQAAAPQINSFDDAVKAAKEQLSRAG